MEYKKEYLEVSFILEKKEDIEIDGDKYFQFEGHASVFENIDLGDDRVKTGAFKKYILDVKAGKEEYPTALWQHDKNVPLGMYIDLKEDDIGLFVKGVMPKDDTFVSGRVIPQMKVGSIRKMSIGYIPIKVSFVTEGEENIRDLIEIQLKEISLVTFAMNTLANITALKSLDEIETLSDVEKLLKENGSFTNKEAKAIISKINELKGNRDDDQKKLLDDEKKFKDMLAEIKNNI